MGQTNFSITSPVMGTFYRSAEPGGHPLAEVGQTIKEGDVVCVIESMKIFTEIRCDKAGRVVKILVENEDAVMKNQDLIEIEPL